MSDIRVLLRATSAGLSNLSGGRRGPQSPRPRSWSIRLAFKPYETPQEQCVAILGSQCYGDVESGQRFGFRDGNAGSKHPMCLLSVQHDSPGGDKST